MRVASGPVTGDLEAASPALTFEPETPQYEWYDPPVDVGPVGDVDGDGVQDLVLAARAGWEESWGQDEWDDVSVCAAWFIDGSSPMGSGTALGKYELGPPNPDACLAGAAADLDRDGRGDFFLAWTRMEWHQLSVGTLPPNGDGGVVASVCGVVGWAGQGGPRLLVADLDADGYDDLVLGEGGAGVSGRVIVHLGGPGL